MQRDAAKLGLALAITAAVAALELYGAYATNSLALLADFAHVLADVGALALAFIAVRVAARPHTLQWTFGFHRAEVLAAAVNALALLAVALVVTLQAIARLRAPAVEVHAGGLLAIAGTGLVANLIAARLLSHGHSLNMRAARLHVLFDLGGSALAILAGLVILPTGWTRIDTLLSLAIVALLVIGALRLLRPAVAVLMDAVPAGIDLAEVERALRALPAIRAVHDIHCWSIADGMVAFAAHIQVAPGHAPQHAIQTATTLLRDRFHITHVTLQPEAPALIEPLTAR